MSKQPEEQFGGVPTIVVKFDDPGFPTFEFVNWKAGISLGTIERGAGLMLREAMRQQAMLYNKARLAEPNLVI